MLTEVRQCLKEPERSATDGEGLKAADSYQATRLAGLFGEGGGIETFLISKLVHSSPFLSLGSRAQRKLFFALKI